MPLVGLRVLDVGCGGGILSESMARLGAQVMGIDVVERNIQIAELHARKSGLAIEYQSRSVEGLVNAAQQDFDVVLNMWWIFPVLFERVAPWSNEVG